VCVCVCECVKFTYAFFIFARYFVNLVKFYDEFTRKTINEIYKWR